MRASVQKPMAMENRIEGSYRLSVRSGSIQITANNIHTIMLYAFHKCHEGGLLKLAYGEDA